MHVALIFDPDSPEEVVKAKRFFQFPESASFPEQETELEQETETLPFDPDENPKLAELYRIAARISKAKGNHVTREICERVGISRISECPENKFKTLAAELALHA